MRILSVITAAQLALSLAGTYPHTYAKAADDVQHRNNIVLFAQFDDLAESNFMAERCEKIEELYNKKGTVHSLSGYINAVSYGKVKVSTYFPQMKDGDIVPYKLSGTRSDYATCEQYAYEIIRNIEVPDDIPLDGDSDGIIDNITLIIDGKASASEDPIWPKSFTVPDTKLNGLNVCTVNIHNSYQVFENVITGAEGVLCHEYMHTLGYPDLYRYGRSGSPVGMWDIMASNSVFVQYPLAYQRAAVSGWLDWTEITESGTYSLAPVSESSGNRLYLLKTPLSDTEFFAVEYRKQGARYSDEMDVKIYGTGLCVYRVNTEVEGNFRENRDGIYVFRPDETDIDAAEGDLTRSNYGGENAPDHIGSLDWNAGIADGALVYSNGTNSGIMLSDITINGDELTFRADFADRSEALLWESADMSALGKYLPYDIASGSDGTVWLAASDYFSLQLFKENNGSFEAVGAPLGKSGTYQPKVEICGGVPYVMYLDNNYYMRLFRLDTQSGKWEDLYTGKQEGQYADMTTDGENLYFAFTEGLYPCTLNAGIYDTQSGKLMTIGSPNRENVCNISIACTGDEMVIGYRSMTNGDLPQISVFPKKNAGKWNTYKFSDIPCSGVSAASDGERVLITPWGSGCGAYVYENGSVTQLEMPEEITVNAFDQTPLIADGKMYIAVNRQLPDELAVYSYDGGKWTAVGGVIAREIVNEFSMTGGNGSLYCSYFTSNSTPAVKIICLGEKQSVRGDVNGDGSFNAADLVALQNYIIGRSDTLADAAAGELSGDGIISIFDVVLMRRMLLV